jgi:hypothetical protein
VLGHLAGPGESASAVGTLVTQAGGSCVSMYIVVQSAGQGQLMTVS